MADDVRPTLLLADDHPLMRKGLANAIRDVGCVHLATLPVDTNLAPTASCLGRDRLIPKYENRARHTMGPLSIRTSWHASVMT